MTKTNLIGVEVTRWENGTGSNEMFCICKDLKSAILLRDGLRKVYPESFNCECGSEKFDVKFDIQVTELFKRDVKDFLDEGDN